MFPVCVSNVKKATFQGLTGVFAHLVREHGELQGLLKRLKRSSDEETQRKLAAHKQAGEPLRAALKQFEEEQFPARFTKFLTTDAASATNAAPWQMCEATSVSATSATLALARDGAVRYLSNKTKDDTYTVKAVTYQRGLRAFRDALLLFLLQLLANALWSWLFFAWHLGAAAFVEDTARRVARMGAQWMAAGFVVAVDDERYPVLRREL